METFVWWEELTTGRGGWRYSGMETGELSVTLCGVQLMLMLFADNYNIHLKTVTTTVVDQEVFAIESFVQAVKIKQAQIFLQ